MNDGVTNILPDVSFRQAGLNCRIPQQIRQPNVLLAVHYLRVIAVCTVPAPLSAQFHTLLPVV